MKLQIIMIVLVASAFAYPIENLLHFVEPEDSTVVDTIFHEEQRWEDLRYSMEYDSCYFSPIVHFIAGPVDIDCSTGEVVIAEGADISSASIKFWRSLEAAYPYLFERGRKERAGCQILLNHAQRLSEEEK